jgi:hypothetical protein
MFSSRITFPILSAAAISLLWAAPSGATTMEELSFEEMTYVADLVAEATVSHSEVERTEGSVFLRTVTTLRLDRVIKGEAFEGERIDVLSLGGRRGPEVTTVASAPVFTPEERVLVFLELRKGEWRVVGMSQGKLSLVEEEDTARDVIVRVQPPRGLPRFEEHLVQLPAQRQYADDLTAKMTLDLSSGEVPPYRLIPGLPQSKDRLFRQVAKDSGQHIDPRWAQLDNLRWGADPISVPNQNGGQR